MPEISLDLDRDESYALLVATEALRQLFCEEDGGIPLVSVIRSGGGAQLKLLFDYEKAQSDCVLAIRLETDKAWPRKGIARLAVGDLSGGVAQYRFHLEGDPDHPQVRFARLEGGG